MRPYARKKFVLSQSTDYKRKNIVPYTTALHIGPHLPNNFGTFSKGNHFI